MLMINGIQLIAKKSFSTRIFRMELTLRDYRRRWLGESRWHHYIRHYINEWNISSNYYIVFCWIHKNRKHFELNFFYDFNECDNKSDVSGVSYRYSYIKEGFAEPKRQMDSNWIGSSFAFSNILTRKASSNGLNGLDWNSRRSALTLIMGAEKQFDRWRAYETKHNNSYIFRHLLVILSAITSTKNQILYHSNHRTLIQELNIIWN